MLLHLNPQIRHKRWLSPDTEALSNSRRRGLSSSLLDTGSNTPLEPALVESEAKEAKDPRDVKEAKRDVKEAKERVKEIKETKEKK